MTYVGSYAWDLRQPLGNRLLLPGAQVLVIDEAGRILFQRSRDTGRWGLPAGAAEPGASFRTTAARELFEETGLQVDPDALVPFASLSRPAEDPRAVSVVDCGQEGVEQGLRWWEALG